MDRFCVRGVVKAGQVVLEIPLNLPDGTFVTVTDHDPDDVAVTGPNSDDPEARAAALQFYLEMLKRRNLLEGSDGQAKIAG